MRLFNGCAAVEDTMRGIYRVISGSVLLLSLLTGCSGGGPAANCDKSKPQLASWRDPIYPGAQHIHPGPRFQDSDSPVWRQTVFDTADSAEAVQTFYQETLEKAGWQVETSDTPAPGTANFTIVNCCAYGWLHVITTPSPAGATQVTVEHGWDMGCG
jgi:hypothetical protein